MAPLCVRPSWPCNYCNVSFRSDVALVKHVAGDQTEVRCLATEMLPEVGRLQCFLDTHMPEEPVLGLEHVVEQQAGPARLYTCLLCDVQADWRKMFAHVVEAEHVKLYLTQDHPELVLRPSDFRTNRGYIRALRGVAAWLHRLYGGWSITVQEDGAPPMDTGMDLDSGYTAKGGSEEGPTLKQENGAPARDTGKDQESGSTAKGGSEERLTQNQNDGVLAGDTGVDQERANMAMRGSEERPTQNTLKRKKAMDPQREAKQPRSSTEIFQYLRHFTCRERFCSLCLVSCPTMVEFYEHITGTVHDDNLARAAPEQLQEYRLQNFLDTHMKGEPLLGLGYIAETYVDPVFMYTCRLCNVQEAWPEIFTHMLQVGHVIRYIISHHRELSPNLNEFCNRDTYVEAVTDATVQVYKTFGDASLADEASKDNIERNTPLPPYTNILWQDWSVSKEKPLLDVSENESCEITRELEVFGVCRDKKLSCRLCQLSFHAPLILCRHIMGTKHRRKLKDASPEVLKKLDCLKFFLDTLLKNEPLVGLEYIWAQEMETSYQYTCNLCNLTTSCPEILFHICGFEHRMSFIKKHHSDHDIAKGEWSLKRIKKSLKDCVTEICREHGRKEIQHVIKNGIYSLPQSGVNDLPSNDGSNKNSAVPLTDKVVRADLDNSLNSDQANCTDREKGNIDNPTGAAGLSAKSGNVENSALLLKEETTPQTSPVQETKPDAITVKEALEFRRNDDFLNDDFLNY